MGLINTIKAYLKARINNKFNDIQWYDINEMPNNMSPTDVGELKSKYNIIFFDAMKRNRDQIGFKSDK